MNAVTTTQPAQELSIVKQLKAKEADFAALLKAKNVDTKSFLANVVNAANGNKDIREGNVSTASVFNVCTRACQDGVMLDGKEAALIIGSVYRDGKWVKEAQYRLMAGGVMKMIDRSGNFEMTACQIIYANDVKHINLMGGGIECPIKHEINFDSADRGEPIGCYFVAKLKNGLWTSPEWMSKAQLDQHRDNFAKDKDGKLSMMWTKSEGEAWRKTLLHKAKKRLALNAEIATALEREELDELGTGQIIDGATGEVVETKIPKRKTTAQKLADAAAKPKPEAEAKEPEQGQTPHDPETGEVIDAKFEDVTGEDAEEGQQEQADDETESVI